MDSEQYLSHCKHSININTYNQQTAGHFHSDSFTHSTTIYWAPVMCQAFFYALWDIAVNNTDKACALLELSFGWEETTNKQTNKKGQYMGKAMKK